MKKNLLFTAIGLVIGLVAGIMTGFGAQRICSTLSRQDRGISVLCQKGVNLMAIWKKDFLDFSFYQEGGNAGIVPAEVAFRDDSKLWCWVINNTVFWDLNRDGIADARVETTKRPKVCFIRQGDRWVRCQNISPYLRTALDQQGKELTFRNTWLSRQ